MRHVVDGWRVTVIVDEGWDRGQRVPLFKAFCPICGRYYLTVEPDEPHSMLTCKGRYQKEPIPSGLREKILQRDNFICQSCGSIDEPVVDHIVPARHGGATHERNLRALCRRCNSRKGAR